MESRDGGDEAVALQAQHGHKNVVTVTRSADRMSRCRVGTVPDHQRQRWGSHPMVTGGRDAVRPPRTGEVKTRACTLVEREREREEIEGRRRRRMMMMMIRI